jgi:Proprotein convertase P-domain
MKTLVKLIKTAAGGGTLLIALAGPAHAVSATFTSAAGTYNIPDNNATGVTVPITITGQPNLTTFQSVTISWLTHGWYGDLRAFLSNGTTTVQLFRNEITPDGASFSSPNADLNGSYSFANAGSNWYTQTNSVVPAGTYQSFQSLSAFNGAALNGTWTLNIQDRDVSVTGAFTQWSFTADVPATAVPFEFSPSLGLILGAGIFGLGSLRKGKGNKVNK